MNWFLLSMKNTFNFEGRARRREFCWFMLIYILVTWGLDFLSRGASTLNLPLVSLGISILHIIFVIIVLIPSCSVTVRRLHDLGYSGWWLLFFFLLQGILSALGFFILTSKAGVEIVVIFCIGLLILFILSLFLYFKDGQKYSNKYGDSPKYPTKVIEQKITDLTV